MIKLTNITNAITRFGGNRVLTIKKYSPEILTTVGVVGVITSTVMACRATLELEEVLRESKETRKTMEETRQTMPDIYTEEKYAKDLTILTVQRTVKVVKHYAPSIFLGTLSIASLLSAQGILRKRNVAIMSAYKLLDEGFNSYRRRVVEQFGEEVDHRLRFNYDEEERMITEKDEDGNDIQVKKKVKVRKNHADASIYAKFFDEYNPNWNKIPEYNLMFLKCKQNYLNDKLRARGHVFLNEVYEELDIPHTGAGAAVGWKISKDGDNYIDFGIFDGDSVAARDFVNGNEASILLDFNVDGVIWDLI